MYKSISIVLITSFLSLQLSSQNQNSYTLAGTIVNGNINTPLVGANIISSNRIGTKTSEIGGFEIHTHSYDTLKISFVGFKTLKYICPPKEDGKYLIKFKMYRDSISLEEIEIFPWPTYKEFKKAFLAMSKENEKIKMKGVNMYVDKLRTAPKPSITNPASFIYDKLFDKKAKMRRRIARRRKTIKKAAQNEN